MTREIVHDRSDPTINIKMFSPMNVMVGRDGASRSSIVQTVSDGVEIESRDNWAEMTTISQLNKALDNLCRLWVVMWPFHYGPANIMGVLCKQRNFSIYFNKIDTRKRVVEDFINHVLGDNVVRAG